MFSCGSANASMLFELRSLVSVSARLYAQYLTLVAKCLVFSDSTSGFCIRVSFNVRES